MCVRALYCNAKYPIISYGIHINLVCISTHVCGMIILDIVVSFLIIHIKNDMNNLIHIILVCLAYICERPCLGMVKLKS